MKYTRPPRHPLSLSIFFPCHDEEGNVERVTLEALEVGRQVAAELEVIIVDDGSRDGTAAIADRLAATHAEVRVVRHDSNQGYGAALRSGFRAATGDWIFYTDGDGQFDLSQLHEFLPLLEEADVFTGYRAEREDTWLRKVNAAAWNWLVRLVFRIEVKDVDCAFKIFPRTFIEATPIISNGFMIDTELLARARGQGLTISQRPVTHLPRVAGSACGGDWRNIVKAFRELLIVRKHLRKHGALERQVPGEVPAESA